MTNKERVYAALAGEPVDGCPVTTLYSFLYHQDHFSELTGLSPWRLHRWLAAPPEEHVALSAGMRQQTPFETLEPQHCGPRAWRERQVFVEREDGRYRHDPLTGEWVGLDLPTISGDPFGYCTNPIDLPTLAVQLKVHDREGPPRFVRTTTRPCTALPHHAGAAHNPRRGLR